MNERIRDPWKASREGKSHLRLLAAVVLLLGTSCGGGKPLNFNAEAIRTKCGVANGVELTEQQALCIAGLAGLKNKKKCPAEISDGRDPDDGSPAFVVRESCSEVALWIGRSSGRVVAVELGGALAPDVEPVETLAD